MKKALSPLQRIALFFDFDGTLVDFAETPDGVIVPEQTRALLLACYERTGGATAVITGREINSLDNLLKLPQIPASGSHGAQWRPAPNAEIEVDSDNILPTEIVELSEDFCAFNNLIFENKTFSVAIHFRQQPQMQATVDQWLQDNIAPIKQLTVQYGKQVREIKRKTFDKGTAVARFMKTPLFKGRTPWFFGDDVTDEAAMAWVNKNDGVSVKVGDGDTCAHYRIASQPQLISYLRVQMKGEEL